MKIKIFVFSAILIFLCVQCNEHSAVEAKKNVPFLWENATVYFLLTDRFCNGDSSNDHSFGREKDGALLRSFMGGDLKGITQKIEEGYFNELGVNAIWLTPPVEQVHGSTDEGTGKTYAYHGYWAYDWTAIDPNFGTWDDLKEMVDVAHKHGIRIVLDVVLNHTGPEIPGEPAWPESWVRTSPTCSYDDFESTVSCTLVENLPDIRTEKEEPVDLPEFLTGKWEREGRLEKEMAELDDFFSRTGYARSPKYHIIKWLTDFIRELGIDGFRVDTAKHTEPDLWQDLWNQALEAFRYWKDGHPGEVMDQTEFYMVGEVYGFNIEGAPRYNYGDTLVNFYDYGFTSLINFAFKTDATKTMEEIFSRYSDKLDKELNGLGIMNYISSHDDSQPFDINRRRVFESGTKLLLAPGTVQIYYGDETARELEVEGTRGDAHLRSMMNWEDLENNAVKGDYQVAEVYLHWSKLGRFRNEHPAVGAGVHQMISETPYSFSRTLKDGPYSDKVMIVIEPAESVILVNDVFADGEEIMDYYSGQKAIVKNNQLQFQSVKDIVLLGIQIR
ncbi:MAG: alpha-amylase [Cyclobacteriaceae bacterium]|nr:alpha-amylase [Cyclobacteriaceae bacterium]